jgi:hypothetical protein
MIDRVRFVNGTAYMDFKKATDILFGGVSHEDLAKTLGISVATVRQARLRPDAKAHRSAPDHWQDAVVRLAEERVQHYGRLINEVKNGR